MHSISGCERPTKGELELAGGTVLTALCFQSQTLNGTCCSSCTSPSLGRAVEDSGCCAGVTFILVHLWSLCSASSAAWLKLPSMTGELLPRLMAGTSLCLVSRQHSSVVFGVVRQGIFLSSSHSGWQPWLCAASARKNVPETAHVAKCVGHQHAPLCWS